MIYYQYAGTTFEGRAVTYLALHLNLEIKGIHTTTSVDTIVFHERNICVFTVSTLFPICTVARWADIISYCTSS